MPTLLSNCSDDISKTAKALVDVLCFFDSDGIVGCYTFRPSLERVNVEPACRKSSMQTILQGVVCVPCEQRAHAREGLWFVPDQSY